MRTRSRWAGAAHRWRLALVAVAAGCALLLGACRSTGDGAGAPGEAEDGPVLAVDRPGVEPAARPASRQPGTTVVAIVGDAGELSERTLAVADLVAAQRPDAVVTTGDNEYTEEGRTVEAYVSSVGAVYGPWVQAGTFFPVPGDHDYGDACDDADAAPDLAAYLDYFRLPAGPEGETYYDVRIGEVHVFALDSVEACHRDGGAKLARQRSWLAQAAGSSDALVKVAVLHNPPYSSGEAHGSAEALRWPFGDWGIDLVVSGDDHIYERSTHGGVVYAVNGLGGVDRHRIGDPIDGSEVRYADDDGALVLVVDELGARLTFTTVGGDEIDRVEWDLAPRRVDASPSPRPALGPTTTWHWQLQGEVDTSVEADVYDVDLFTASPDLIRRLHDAGRTVVCYFSAGSHEPWRPDAAGFRPADLGSILEGFEDERWLDVRSTSVRRVATGRLELARAKGCDGVEPDNVDGYLNPTGFELTAADQLAFNRFVAEEAHERGLLVGLKNDLDQIGELADAFDFAVNEQCHEYDECHHYGPFLDAGKPVFNAEYAQAFVDDPGPVCASARARGLRTLVLPVDLDGSFRLECDLR